MKVNIPHELKMKFLSLEGLNIERDSYEIPGFGGTYQTVPGPNLYSVKLDLSGNPKCLKACLDWYSRIQTYFKTSYRALRFDIGPYIGIWPVKVGADGVVEFQLDDVDLDRKDWKDWFVKGDMEYAPEQST